MSVTGNVRTNDTLGDGTAVQNVTSLNGSATGAYGSIVLGGAGGYTYTLDNANPLVQQLAPGETLTETYSYTLTDKDGDTSVASLVITITGTDDLPVAVADTGTIAEDAVSVTGNVRTNDTLGDGTAVQNVTSLNGSATGAYGSIVLGGAGGYTYTLDNANPLVQQLAPGETLTETYSYTLTDKDGDTSVASLVITITGTDDTAGGGCGHEDDRRGRGDGDGQREDERHAGRRHGGAELRARMAARPGRTARSCSKTRTATRTAR